MKMIASRRINPRKRVVLISFDPTRKVVVNTTQTPDRVYAGDEKVVIRRLLGGDIGVIIYPAKKHATVMIPEGIVVEVVGNLNVVGW